MNWISSLKAYRSIKVHRKKGKGLDNWKPEKRRQSSVRKGTDLLDQLGQLIKSSHRWPNLVSVPGLLYHSYQNSQSRTAEDRGVSYLSESQHGWHLVTGPALQTWTTELEGVCPVGNNTTCHVNLLILWHKIPGKGTVLFWRHEGQQLCLLFKTQYYRKLWGLVLSMI